VVGLETGRRRVALALRSALVLTLILALSGVNWVMRSNANCVLFIVDASYSVPRPQRQKALNYINQAVSNMRDQDKIGVLTVGSEARLVVSPTERGKITADLSVPDGSQTNLARGITTAMSYFPENTAPRIVLISDGNETTGSVLDAARSAAADRIPVDVVVLNTAPENEMLLDRMLTPPTAKRGEPFPVKIIATSLKGGKGVLKLFRNGKYVGEKSVDLQPGKNAVTIPQTVESPGFYTYEARLICAPGQDTFEENNRAISFVKVEGTPRILLVRSNTPDAVPEGFLPQALAAQSVQIDTIAPKDLPKQATTLLNYDGLILSDVPVSDLSDAQQHMIQAAVRDLGIGLIMVGGVNSFGAGGYWQTPIEEALPVDMDIRKMRRFPGVALALAIDYSGSMEAAAIHGSTQQSKLELAQEAAHRAVDALNAQDQVGVLAVDTEANVVYPLSYATDKRAIHSAIGGIWGGSGTEMSAAVKGCYEMLENADAKIKHAILVTDGETGPYDYGDLIQAFRAKKITFSLVIIDEGQADAGIDPLKRVVERTGGRFYRVGDPSEIPKIYTREVLTISKPPILEEPFVPRVALPGSPMLSGVNWDSVPPLLGYNVTVPKPTAEVPLVSHKGDPILATWQYGLGKSVAFTSDAKARWGAQWVTWSGYGPFWAQAVRWALKKTESGSYQSAIELSNGKGHITVDAVDEQTGAYVNFLDTKARVIGPDGTVQTVRLTQSGAGRYSGSFEADKTGSYVASLQQTGRDGKTRATAVGVAVPYSPEYAALQPNTALLLHVAELTGGHVLSDGASVFKERNIRILPVPLALPLLAMALLLFPLDVANRRVNLSRQQAQQTVASLREKAAARQTARQQQAKAEATLSVARLQARKAAIEDEEQQAAVADRATTAILHQEETPRPVVWGNSPATKPSTADPKTDAAADYRARLLEAKRRAARDDE
jgi:uncharacterized membrane protein